MTRDVLARKLRHLETLLADLRPHLGKSVQEVIANATKIERLLELMVHAPPPRHGALL
jgi:hypothetical protein